MGIKYHFKKISKKRLMIYLVLALVILIILWIISRIYLYKALQNYLNARPVAEQAAKINKTPVSDETILKPSPLPLKPPVTPIETTKPPKPEEIKESASDEEIKYGVGNLPAAETSGEEFNKDQWFGYSSPDDVIKAVHEKTMSILAQANNLRPEVLQLGLRAYACAHQNDIGKPRRLTIIDYSLPSTSKRMWVIDLKTAKVEYNTLVAHGKNSGYINTTNFSNIPQSKASSIGLFMATNTYSGHNGYSLRLQGLEPGFNDHAQSRSVVIHGASYVNENFVKKYHYLGRSWGCPALSKVVSTPIINKIKNGTLVFSYYPVKGWLNKSTFLHCKAKLPWKW